LQESNYFLKDVPSTNKTSNPIKQRPTKPLEKAFFTFNNKSTTSKQNKNNLKYKALPFTFQQQ
jgi:hypothetical protein